MTKKKQAKVLGKAYKAAGLPHVPAMALGKLVTKMGGTYAGHVTLVLDAADALLAPLGLKVAVKHPPPFRKEPFHPGETEFLGFVAL